LYRELKGIDMPTRRILMGLGLTAVLGGALAYPLVFPAFGGTMLDAPTAHEKQSAGDILLIDIRRPDEWAATGSAQGAKRLDMRRDDFIAALDQIAGGDRSRPIALICARGVRSARTANLLVQNGFSNIIDIPEGMLGSGAGPGWIARGLPVVRN
jgi:rhodanese-related sulfurtransferase